jgi:hypothetical protein
MTENEDDPYSWEGEDWLVFPEAVGEIVAKLDLSRGVAERTLRVLCGSGDIRSICCDEDFEEKPTIIMPEKWRETGELDLHGVVVSRVKWTDNSRSIVRNFPNHRGKLDVEEKWNDTVLVSEADLRHWLKKQTKEPAKPRQKPARSREIARQVVEAIWNGDPPATVSNAQIEQQVGKRLKELGRSDISNDTILRAAGRK